MHDLRTQSRLSDPGRHGVLLDALPHDPLALAAAVGELLVHYRRTDVELPVGGRETIHCRSVAEMLDRDQARHGAPLTAPRRVSERVQGCCRDFALILTSTLRRRGIGARTVVGYAGYFTPGWHHDHVITEAWIDGERLRLDPEVPHLNPIRAEFVTAAEAWRSHRRGEIDASRYGVAPDVPELAGEPCLAVDLLYQLAHRYGDELLLWDSWGVLPAYDEPLPVELPALLDDIADALVAAETDPEADAALEHWYRSDARLHPGETVVRYSPFGAPPVRERWA